MRKKQYQLSDDKIFTLHISKLFVAAKIHNYRNIVLRYIRDNGRNILLEKIAQILYGSKKDSLKVDNINQLRGIEGDAANSYFSIFQDLIISQKSDFVFTGRNRRPPKDEVNAMLSFVYTLIANELSSALESVGLDPYVGFMHSLRPGRTSLALDVMEEMRAYLGDRLVLSLINRRQVCISDFNRQGEDGVIMTDSCKKIIISAWQNRKKEIITHPFLKEKIEIGLLPYVQSMLLARYLRGDIEEYPVFLIQ